MHKHSFLLILVIFVNIVISASAATVRILPGLFRSMNQVHGFVSAYLAGSLPTYFDPVSRRKSFEVAILLGKTLRISTNNKLLCMRTF